MRQDTAWLQSSFADSRRTRSGRYDPDPASYPVTQACARWVRSSPNAGIAYDSARSAVDRTGCVIALARCATCLRASHLQLTVLGVPVTAVGFPFQSPVQAC
ncbi:RES domain-containing protein [Marivita cryptomonadis]|uniref:RES domain-containing protein n=1 Tax=Marivita cryptomonadis TaxID=505252 RepID=A0A9Q2P385_9RHOB|nr:RES domain-containing protein [Marivita cryptomonadis]MBM2333231.1 RES domain-containing protein [Marivita cryptomonadis]MBM2342810.1 RES domain-containing protein [Marivita cryptomonadis]MBM2347479.1 RES domain-containing protein [Marivita cryptomonadis]MBM2352162.1 RES domain-containing protein [Marivita cryptomonadis]